MPHNLSAKKRLRQNLERRERNRSVRSEVKTCVKKLLKAVEDKDKALAADLFRMAIAKIDKSVKKGVYHANTAARKKSGCAKILNQLG